MSTWIKWIGIVACGGLAALLLVSAWHHIGDGAYARTILCLALAALFGFVVYLEVRAP